VRLYQRHDIHLIQLIHCPRKIKGTLRVQVNAAGRLGSLPGSDRLRGPSRMGNLLVVMLGSLRRAIGWQLCARTIRGLRSPRKTFLRYSGLSAGLWMSALKRSSPPELPLHIGVKEHSVWSDRIRKPVTGWLLECLCW
jgi:hypothetical protein